MNKGETTSEEQADAEAATATAMAKTKGETVSYAGPLAEGKYCERTVWLCRRCFSAATVPAAATKAARALHRCTPRR